MKVALLVLVAAAATAKKTNAASDLTTGLTTELRSKLWSTEYQAGSYPYIPIAGATPGIVDTVDECMRLCDDNAQCKYGTFVTAGATLPGGTHAYMNSARAGECWLSGTTHASKTRCGVACQSFRKVAVETDSATGATETTPAPFYPSLPSAVPVNKPKDQRKHGVCHDDGTTRECSMSCHCDPFAHPSAYTKCHIDAFTNRMRVYHLDPKFHTRPFHPTTQHHCAHKDDQGCSCCSCDDIVGVHSFVGVGINRHIVDVVGDINSGLIMDGSAKYFIAESIEDCERQCSERSYQELDAFMPMDVAYAIEVVEGHSRLDCQARCDANPQCGFVSISDDEDQCALLPHRHILMGYSTFEERAPASGEVTLARMALSNACSGGSFIQSGPNKGRCYLATTLVSEDECHRHPTKCMCDTDMGCFSFRRRPNQFHQTLDGEPNYHFHGADAAAYYQDCAAVEGEVCYNYPECAYPVAVQSGDTTGTAFKQPCGNDADKRPAWMSSYYVAGKKQCCGAGLRCGLVSDGTARCQLVASR